MPASPSNQPLLHCPTASQVDAFVQALRRGDVFIHAFPHDGGASYYPDASLFEAALRLPQLVAEQAGIPPPTVISQRDIPGTTRAVIPILRAHGIQGISIGAGTTPGKPDTLHPCLYGGMKSLARIWLSRTSQRTEKSNKVLIDKFVDGAFLVLRGYVLCLL
jgi:hypothetical protein